MCQKLWGSYETIACSSKDWPHQWLTLSALHLLTAQSERWQMLNGEETDDWVFGSYNQHGTYFWVMNHHFYPSHTVLVHSLHRKPVLCKGLMAGQWAPLLVESCRETALERSEDLMAKGCCAQYCFTIICQPHIKLWEYGTTCQEISKSLFIVNKNHCFLLVKTRLRMQWRQARCQKWHQGRNIGPLPCEPLEIEVKSHHKIILQSSVKTWNKCTEMGKKRLNNISIRSAEAHLQNHAPHKALGSLTTGCLGPGPGDLPDVITGQKWPCSYLPNPHWWQWGAAALFGTTVHVLFSSAVHCQDLLPSPPLPPNSESGSSSRTDPGFWYILHGLSNTNFHHSSTQSQDNYI